MAAPAAKRMKGPTAYMLFSEEQRPEVMGRLRAEAPDGKVAVTVVAKAIGELWKGLSEEQKAAYKEKAQQRAAEAAAAAAEAAEAAGQGEGGAGADAADAAAPAPDPGLPRGVVKKVMLLDPEVQRVSADAVWLVGEAVRLFLHALAAKGAAAVSAKKRKTIMLQDFDTLVRSDRRLVEAGMKDIVANKGLFFGSAAAASGGTKRKQPQQPAAAADGADGKQQQDQQGEDDSPAAAEQQQEEEETLTDEQRIALAEVKARKTAAAAKARAAKAAERAAAQAAAEAAGTKRITTFFNAAPKAAAQQQQESPQQSPQQQQQQDDKENQGVHPSADAGRVEAAAKGGAASGSNRGGVQAAAAAGPLGEYDVAAELEAELDAALAEHGEEEDESMCEEGVEAA